MQKSSRHPNPVKDALLVAHHSLKVHPRLSGVMLGPCLIFGVTGLGFWLMQSRLTDMGTSPFMVGVALGAYFAFNAMVAMQAGRLLHMLGEKRLLLLLPITLSAGIVLMVLAPSPWLVWLGALIGTGFTYAVGDPLATNLINHEVTDGERATVHSVSGTIITMYSSTVMLTFSPLQSWLGTPGAMATYLVITFALMAWPYSKLLCTQPHPPGAPA